MKQSSEEVADEMADEMADIVEAIPWRTEARAKWLRAALEAGVRILRS